MEGITLYDPMAFIVLESLYKLSNRFLSWPPETKLAKSGSVTNIILMALQLILLVIILFFY